jgi:TonB family protein
MPVVRFALLGALDFGRASLPRRELLPGLGFTLVHLAGLLAVHRAAPADLLAESAGDFETVTYLDVPPPAEPESPRKIVRPRPVAVSEAVIIPAAAGSVERPDKVAGFQELLAPREIKTLPPPDPAGATVYERDFSGRGIVGGVAGGKPPPVLPPDLAAAMAREGRISDEAAAAARSAAPIQPVELEAVDTKPRLLNREDVMTRLLAQYPPFLKNAGIAGQALVEFIVDTAGSVVPGSVRVLTTTHGLFGDAALVVVPHARFSPARMSLGGAVRTVPVRVRIPLAWSQAPPE